MQKPNQKPCLGKGKTPERPSTQGARYLRKWREPKFQLKLQNKANEARTRERILGENILIRMFLTLRNLPRAMQQFLLEGVAIPAILCSKFCCLL